MQFVIAKHDTFEHILHIDVFPIRSSTPLAVGNREIRCVLCKTISFKPRAPRKSFKRQLLGESIPGSLWFKSCKNVRTSCAFEKTSFGYQGRCAFHVRSSMTFLGRPFPARSSTTFCVQLFISHQFLKKIHALSLELHVKLSKWSGLIIYRKIRWFLKSLRFWILFQVPVGSSETCKDFASNPCVKLNFSSL